MLEFIGILLLIVIAVRFSVFVVVLMALYGAMRAIQGLFAAHDFYPPDPKVWQMPWNVVHGKVTGDEVFWTVFVTIMVSLICWGLLRARHNRIKEGRP